MAKDPSKSEAPSEKKLEDARKEGKTIFSQDLAAVIMLATAVLLLFLTIENFFVAFSDIFSSLPFHTCRDNWSKSFMLQHVKDIFMILAENMLLPLLSLMFMGIFAAWGQFGVYIETKPLEFEQSLQKMSPQQGLQQILPNQQNLVRLGLSVLKVSIVLLLVYLFTRRSWEDILALPLYAFSDSIEWVFRFAFMLALRLLAVLIVAAAIDYGYRRWSHFENQKMSMEDLKEEWRQSYGDPQIKSRRKQRMREMSMLRMISEVPKADVVITNPTHVAVAVRYRRGDWAPRVVAKGLRKRALRIRQIATRAGVPIVEDKPLARAMYREAGIGSYIPSEFFAAVAVILARLQRRKTGVRQPQL